MPGNKRLPAPGTIVQTGDVDLHVYGKGEGEPQVLLEAGIAASSISWSLVQPSIARFTRAVSYDRSGFGWSGPCKSTRTPERILGDLTAVIDSSAGKWVLAGHSFGALVVLLFASRFPERVAGIVLIDPPLFSEWAKPNELRRKMLHRGASLSRRGALLARLGVVRAALALLTGGARWLPKAVNRMSAGRGSSVTERLVGEVRKLPREHWPAIQSHWSRPQGFESMALHLEALPEMARAAASAKPVQDLPLTVISGHHLSDEALAEHAALAHLSTRGKHLVANAGGHWVLLDEPETVVSAVREIVDQVREHPSLRYPT